MEMKNLLAAKLARILGEVGKVPKSGRNEFHKYDYVTENDLVYAVRDKLAAAGIFVFTSVESQAHELITSEGRGGEAKQSLLTTVTTRHTFVDGESGEQFSVLSQGQGAEPGDKGGYKAITGAMKYFLYKCFMVPTGDDPESDPTTDERTAGGVRHAAPAAAASTPPKAALPAASPQSGDVPRDIPDDVRARFRDGKWQHVKIHFGKNKGTELAQLESKSLEWYVAEWQPKPYNGKISEADIALRAALDVANDEWK